MHRVLFAVYRKPGVSTEEFLSHYEDVHFPIARRLPGLEGYEIFPIQGTGDGADGAPDAFALMTFDSPEDFEAALASPEMAEAVEDNATFIDRFDTYVVGRIGVVGATTGS